MLQLQRYGLKITEYSLRLSGLCCCGSFTAVFMKDEAHKLIALITCAAVVFQFSRFGYHALPAAAQVSRLEKLLISQGMLEGRLVPLTEEPERSIRESITDAVMYIADSRDAELPAV